MTGFGRGEGARDGIVVTCELRSVNGKGLDLRFRLPGRLDRLEPELKTSARQQLARGNVQVNATVERDAPRVELRLDHATLDHAVSMAREVAHRHDLAMPNVGTFLGMRGVVEAAEIEEDEGILHAAAREAFEVALNALQADRAREGDALFAILEERVDRIAALAAQAEADPSRRVEAVREHLAERVAQLGGMETLDEDRLHAEAAFLVVKSDLSEELDRLRAHVDAARALLASDEPVGRRFEFLAQEFGREANTLCAKSNAASLTAIGLELKVVIDQLREQIANVE